MKNVLYILSLIILISLASCAPDASQTLSTPTATETLRPFPTSTRTPIPRLAGESSNALVSSDPTATPFVHIVQEGDTLLSIALTYGVGLEELVLVNPGIDPQFLSVGTSLRIPGPEGEAADVLLPTPTPVAIEQSGVRCFEALTGEFRCLAEIDNPLPFTIEALSGIIGLYDQQGDLLTQKSTDSTLQFLPSEQSMPLSAVFAQKPEDFGYADLRILSAIEVASEVSRFVPVELLGLDWQKVEYGSGVLVEVQIDPQIDSDEGVFELRILGMAFDEQGEIIGYRLVDRTVNTEEADSIQENFYILSLGPEIDDVGMLIEMTESN